MLRTERIIGQQIIRQIPFPPQTKKPVLDVVETASPIKNNVIPFRIPDLSIKDIKRKLLHLNDGWKNLSPFFNAHLKVFPIKNSSSDIWLLIWTKDGETSELNEQYKPIPKNSMLYNCFSGNVLKKKILEEGERILYDSFLAAKEFTGKNCEDSNFVINIIGEKGYGMCVTGANSIEIASPNIDSILSSIEDDNELGLNYLKNYFKGAFAHEMTHQMRGELEVQTDTGQEIASHAIELLACGGENPFSDRKFLLAIDEQDSSYHKDMVTSLKVVEHFLARSKKCTYKPKNCNVSELNKSMKSIPEKEREGTLSKIAEEIIESSNIELLRIAAGIGKAWVRHSAHSSRGPG